MNTLEKPDFFEVGDKTALLSTDAEVGAAARTSLRDLGFKFHIAGGAQDAMERMRYTPFDIVILQDGSEGVALDSGMALAHLAELPMAQRRHAMVVWIGAECRTLDAIEAFSRSVQVVVNRSDLEDFTAILKKSWTEFEELYKVYRNVFASLGEK